MAEYNDIIKHFKRMCRYYNNKATQNDCPLYCKGHGCNISHCRMLAFDDKKFANVVMAWAAEHPEPVYPSIAKYLERFGIMIRRDGSLQADFFRANEPMSAEMAKLLGISSGEGENEKAD